MNQTMTKPKEDREVEEEERDSTYVRTYEMLIFSLSTTTNQPPTTIHQPTNKRLS